MHSMIFSALIFLQAPTQPQTKAKEAPTKTEKEAVAATSSKTTPTTSSSRSVMLIDPKARASDYLKAFEILRQEKSTSKVVFELANGTSISNVIDMKLMPDNTLVVFRFNTAQGIKFQVAAIEDLIGIKHL